MPEKPKLVLADRGERVRLWEGDSLQLLAEMPEESVDCVWTDPPYNLSNDGITCIAGKMVKVNKQLGGPSFRGFISKGRGIAPRATALLHELRNPPSPRPHPSQNREG